MKDQFDDPSHHEQTLWVFDDTPILKKKKRMFYLTMHTIRFIYGYMVLNISEWTTTWTTLSD